MAVTLIAPVPTVDDIIDGLRPHVWTLMEAGMVEAAVVLLEANVEEFMRASMEPHRDEVLEGVVVDDDDDPSTAVALRPAMALRVWSRTP